MGEEDILQGRAGAATGLVALVLLLVAADAIVNGLHPSWHQHPAYDRPMGALLLLLPVAAAGLATPFQQRVFLPVFVGLSVAAVVLSVVEAHLGNQRLEFRHDKVSHLDEVLFEPGVGALAGTAWWALLWWRAGNRGAAAAMVVFIAAAIACYIVLR